LEPGAAKVDSVHASGPMRRVRLTLAGRIVEALLPEGAALPVAGETCGVDLSRARIYPA
jgi:hypothetical protein